MSVVAMGGGIESSSSALARGVIACSAAVRPSIFDSSGGKENECCSSASSTTSSIGKNSDDVTGGRDLSDGEVEDEVQSAFSGAGVLDSMDALEEVLPIRRGISKFYCGKSKSFTSLADASFSSVEDIAKPENAYSRRRRNLLASNLVWERNRSFPHLSNGGGILKRPVGSSRSTLALAVAMNSSESLSSASEDSNSSSHSKSPPLLPPLYPRSKTSHSNLASLPSSQQKLSSWRSLSVTDLQHCSALLNKSLNGPSVCDETDDH